DPGVGVLRTVGGSVEECRSRSPAKGAGNQAAYRDAHRRAYEITDGGRKAPVADARPPGRRLPEGCWFPLPSISRGGRRAAWTLQRTESDIFVLTGFAPRSR